MMLAYKAWRESRARFLMAALTLGWFCSMFVVFQPMMLGTSNKPFAEFVIDSIYAGSIREIFVLLITACAMGGLTQEHERGTVLYTLALPVSRTRLVWSRASVGFLEVTALSLIPTAAVLVLSPAIGETFSAREALRYSLQWAVTGSVVFAVALLLSVSVTGTYAALSASILLLMAYAALLNVAVIRAMPALNVFALMNRAHPATSRLVGAAAVAVSFVGAAIGVTGRQDF